MAWTISTLTHPADERHFRDLSEAYEYAAELVGEGFAISAIDHDGREHDWERLHALVQGWDE